MCLSLCRTGSVYSAIYQGLVDIKNLSELLFESPDIIDAPNAQDIPVRSGYNSAGSTGRGASDSASGGSGTGASVEFRGVFFHYPEQPAEKGLKNVSIMVKPGTTTAIVGHTGAGEIAKINGHVFLLLT